MHTHQENMLVQHRELALNVLVAANTNLAVAIDALLALAHILHLVGQTNDLVQLALATILGGHLVLAAPTNVANQRQLRFGEVVLGQAFVELVHGQIDDFVHWHRNL